MSARSACRWTLSRPPWRRSGAILALPPYLDSGDTFAPVGDEEGLLIVVRAGRHWFPTTDAATALPIAVTLAGDHPRDYALPGSPHTLTVTSRA